MIEFIESTVLRQFSLSVKENKGEHHRIMKTGWHGSLWIVKTERLGYRVETTGSVGTMLNPEIRNLLGSARDRVTVKGYSIWFVDTPAKVEKLSIFMDDSEDQPRNTNLVRVSDIAVNLMKIILIALA